MKKFTLVSALVLSVILVSKAQETSQTVNIKIQGLSDIVFTAVEDPQYIFEGLTDLENGIERHAGGLQIRSNRPWEVSASVDLSAVSADVDNVIPSDFFQLAVGAPTDVLSFVSLSAVATSLTSGERGAGSSNERAISYKINPGYKINPASYDVTVTYTLSQQ